jgi:FtsZ-interacting cell division protein ZipA
MKKIILLITSAVGIVALFIAGAYYLAVFLPQKQKASMDIVKLELEAKIEQEKTDQLRIEQENQIREADKQKAEEEKQQEIINEANQQAEIKKKQQGVVSAALSKCLANADAVYEERASRVKPASNADSLFDFLNANRIQARNECYK